MSAWKTVYFWFLALLLSAFSLELGCAAGWLSEQVLRDVSYGFDAWWNRAAWLHIFTAFMLAAVILLSASLFTTPGIPDRNRSAVGLAAVLLSTHLSLLYLVLPAVLPVGNLIACALLITVLRPRSIVNSRSTFLPETRSGRTLWSILGLLVLVAFFNQFGELKKVVSGVTDFGMFYDAATALQSGGDPYRSTNGGYFYPPAFAYYFRFLTWLPKCGASLLWFTVKLSLLFWSFGAVYRLVDGGSAAGKQRFWLVFGMVTVAARFLFADLQYGNTNTFVLWLLIAAVYFDSEDRCELSGLALAGAVSIKVVPAVFVFFFLARGRLSTVAWTAICALVLNLAPFLLDGGLTWAPWTTYLQTGIAGKLSDSLAQPDNQSLWGVLNRSFDLPLAQGRIVWAGLSLVLTAVAVWAARSQRRFDMATQAGSASLFFLLGLLVSPGSWVVHYCAVLLPMTYLLREALKNTPPALAIWCVFVAANVAFTVSGWFRITVGWSINQSWFVAAALILFAALTFLTTRRAALVLNRQESD